MDSITQLRLKELLHYDPETGVFRWAVDRANVVKKGDVAGKVAKSGYRQIKVDAKHYQASRLAWLYTYGQWPEHQIDHINCDRTDDRIQNLRDATSNQNAQNRGRTRCNTSGQKGVHWAKSKKKWRAAITADGVTKHLGYFDDLEQAGAAYATAASSYHREFARIEN